MLLPVSVLSLFFQQPLRNLSVHISCLVVGMESQDASHRKADENYSSFLADLAKLCLTSPLVEQYKSVLSIDHIIVQLVHFCCQVWRMRGLTAILVAHKKTGNSYMQIWLYRTRRRRWCTWKLTWTSHTKTMTLHQKNFQTPCFSFKLKILRNLFIFPPDIKLGLCYCAPCCQWDSLRQGAVERTSISKINTLLLDLFNTGLELIRMEQRTCCMIIVKVFQIRCETW